MTTTTADPSDAGGRPFSSSPGGLGSPGSPGARGEPRVLALLLRPFAKVEPDEAVSALVLMLTVFLLLMAYYLLKIAREPLILLSGGAEVKSYAAAGQALLLLAVVPAYSALAKRVGRMKLIAGIYGFFAANLLVFALFAHAGMVLGVAFYLWVGVFSVTAIAQFWSFANDVYDPEQGKRLFALLGIGSSVGAAVGSLVAKQLAPLGPRAMMLGAAVVLVVCIGLFAWTDRRERTAKEARDVRSGPATAPKPVIEGPVLGVLLRDKYLLLIAALIFLLNCVNTNGEYVLDRTLLAAVGQSHQDPTAFVGAFKADYFSWVNIAGVLLQMFAVSRVLHFIGVRGALFILPLVAFASYSVILALPMLALIRVGKVAENSLDYSVQNTARQALFLVGTRVEKYVGKTVVDTFVVRFGDVFSAGLVWGASQLALPVSAFAALNLGFIACWLLVVAALGREHKRRSAMLAQQPGAELRA
jgi:ATP:ADP antiporter, AAA family